MLAILFDAWDKRDEVAFLDVYGKLCPRMTQQDKRIQHVLAKASVYFSTRVFADDVLQKMKTYAGFV